MKIKSLLLGSIAAAGLSTGAFAADLGVLTSLDVCDSLGISGLTISSDTNCLAITGEISYEFKWGDYAGDAPGYAGGLGPFNLSNGTYKVDNNDDDGNPDNAQDWASKVEAWIRFEASADSDFGKAIAVLKLKKKSETKRTNEDITLSAANHDIAFDEAYVMIGDGTYLAAGKKGSIIKKGDDEGWTFLELYNANVADHGVKWSHNVSVKDGGHVIQLTSVIGDGVSVGVGLEDLANDGLLVGFIEYAGEMISAHATIMAIDILDANVTDWAYHTGATFTYDNFKFLAAIAGDSSGYWNGTAGAQATFDMFTLAAGIEGTHTAAKNELGFSISGAAEVSDGVTINAGFRYFDFNTGTADTEIWEAAVSLVAAVSENLTATGQIGIDGENFAPGATSVAYGLAKLEWAPGGAEFTSSVEGKVNAEGAYKFTFKAKKTFK